jgi:dihydropteroate synthase
VKGSGSEVASRREAGPRWRPRGADGAVSPVVMGILNVTPDSFSDGGLWVETALAIDAAMRMEGEGATIIDVGGESTRPGADPVPLEVELERVLPVVEGIRQRSEVAISIDTRNAPVAAAALEAGANMVNDVTALRHDPAMAAVVRDRGADVILMHMRGEPKTMQDQIRFSDLIGEIRAELTERKNFAMAQGIAEQRILIDPGIGFGKTFEQNLEIVARSAELDSIAPVVIGASRKGFIGHLTGKGGGRPRMAGSLATVAAAALSGAAIVRVHDVAETVDFLRVFNPLMGRRV